ncbi:MAG: prephenate dehydratase [Propionibacteriaceae bacterium]|jgi:prephenate dehydratase|nr:prephenate dehydratase [Propionibacteriaceae bacterium]
MLGYFGPEGTFTHQALLALRPGESAQPYLSVPGVLEAVRHGQITAGLVPIENSVEGGVSATLDYLAGHSRLQIIDEVLLEVAFGLYVRPGTAIEAVRTVLTHPHAAAQVRGWLAEHLPDASVTEQGSTADAARRVADPESGFDAAICAAVAGELYGLEPLATQIADNRGAVTRFILVSRPVRPAPISGHDKTSLVIHLRADQPGGLIEALQQFAARGINLCRVESRPEKTKIGHYSFSIDAQGHVFERRMQAALAALHRTSRRLVFLGSYPSADGQTVKQTAGSRDEEFAASDRWLAGVLNPSRVRGA